MTRKEFNYIEDVFSQILDDIAGNPEWYEAARALASDLGTLERELEKKVVELPLNLDEAANKFAVLYDQGTCDGIAQDCFKAGAEWMAEQGQFKEGIVCDNNEFIKFPDGSFIDLRPNLSNKAFDVKDGDEVIVNISRKSNG